MTSFWNLFILFVVINIPFAFVPLAFENSGQFDCDDLNKNGVCDVGEPPIDWNSFNSVEYPDSLKVD